MENYTNEQRVEIVKIQYKTGFTPDEVSGSCYLAPRRCQLATEILRFDITGLFSLGCL